MIEMVFFHLMWDLNYFGLYQTNILGGPWQLFARNIAATFLLVLGISLTLSHGRAAAQANGAPVFPKFLRRGGQIFGLGLLITAATYFFIGPGYVRFGILHLLGASIIVAYPFLGRSRWAALTAGLASLGLGAYLNTWVVTFPWLIWLGVKQGGIYMVDYYPLLPWGGFALLGVFAGYSLYPQGRRRFALPDWSNTPPINGLRFLGRHSLLIYLVHQPLLIGLLMALGFGSF
jgi:uncharacterized membrane protein